MSKVLIISQLRQDTVCYQAERLELQMFLTLRLSPFLALAPTTTMTTKCKYFPLIKIFKLMVLSFTKP